LPVVKVKTFKVVLRDKTKCQPIEIAGNQEDILDYQYNSFSLV